MTTKELKLKLIEKCKQYRKDQIADPWSFGMNIEMTEGYARGMEDVIELLEGDRFN